MQTKLATLSLTVILGLLGSGSVGCAGSAPVRVSHAPTYSYMQDADARAEIDLWPALAGDSESLASFESRE